MKSKKTLIKEYIEQDYTIGDHVTVRGLDVSNKAAWGHSTDIVGIGYCGVFVQPFPYKEPMFVKLCDVMKTTRHIGYNPFPKKPIRVRSFDIDIDMLLKRCMPDTTSEYFTEKTNMPIRVCNHDPIVIDKDGKIVTYQRELCWKPWQKKGLIDSVYDGMDIGLFTVRKRFFDELDVLAKRGVDVLAFSDVVDGKQRLNTLKEFVDGKFKDNNGMYYHQMSDNSQHKFMSCMNFTYAELPENSLDKDVIEQFLKVNNTGVPVSKKHINYVKEINI